MNEYIWFFDLFLNSRLYVLKLILNRYWLIVFKIRNAFAKKIETSLTLEETLLNCWWYEIEYALNVKGLNFQTFICLSKTFIFHMTFRKFHFSFIWYYFKCNIAIAESTIKGNIKVPFKIISSFSRYGFYGYIFTVMIIWLIIPIMKCNVKSIYLV